MDTNLTKIKTRTLLSHRTPCTRTHWLGALLLVATTHFITKLFDHFLAPPAVVDISCWSNQDRSHISLKIYVYDEEEVEGLKLLMYGKEGNVDVDICYRGQWGTQVKIHKLLLNSRFRTQNKEEADFFFVPAYVKCVHMLEGLIEREINQTYVEVLKQLPYFRRSGGRDHIFVFPSGNGAHFFTSWHTFLNISIFLTPEGDRTDNKNATSFSTWKDIIIPGNVDDEMTNDGTPLVESLPLSKRKYLANYLGRAQGRNGRLLLLQLAKQYPDKLEAPDLKHDTPHKLEKVDYFQHLGNAKFCLVPRGLSSWTLRFYESFFVECIPVILSDRIELPFQNVIDYTQFTIKWPSTQIGPQLLQYLESIPDATIERMIAKGREVKCFWVYKEDSEACSAMQGIFWELQRKIRVFHQSAETFWLHNGTVVNRNLLAFHDWVPPMPLP